MEDLARAGGDVGVGRGESEARRRTVLARCPVFAALDAAVLADVAARASIVRVVRKQTLYEAADAGQGVWVIASGRVRLARPTEDQGEVAIGYRGPSELVGEESLLATSPVHAERATALENVEAVRLSHRATSRLLDGQPAAALALARIVHERRAQAEARIHGLVAQSVVSRLATFLLDARKRFGIPESRGTLIGARFTHQEIAEWVGATRETVTLSLGEWKRKGIVVFDHRRIVVVDEPRLAKLV